MKITIPTSKIPKINIKPAIFIKSIITILYLGFCAVILTPQIDYQDWYPSFFNKHDLNLSITFQEHKVVTIKKANNELSDKNIANLTQAIYNRAKTAEIETIYFKNKTDTYELHLPKDTSDAVIDTLLAPGKIEFKKLIPQETPSDIQGVTDSPDTNNSANTDNTSDTVSPQANKETITIGDGNDDNTVSTTEDTDDNTATDEDTTDNNTNEEDTDSNSAKNSTSDETNEEKPDTPEPTSFDPMYMQNPTNYEYTGIKPSRIKDARITNAKDNVVYIELDTDKDQIRRIEEISQDGSTFAVFTDGTWNLAYLMPPNETTMPKPTLILTMQPQKAKILVSQILNEPLNHSKLDYEIDQAEPIYSQEILYGSLGAIAISILIGLAYKIFVQKTQLNIIIGTAFLLLGFMTLIKFASISISIPILILIIALTSLLAFLKHTFYPSVAIACILIAFAFSIGVDPILINTFKLLIISGIYVTGFYILLFFMRIYEA